MSVTDQLNRSLMGFYAHLPYMLGFIATLWAIHGVNILTGYRLTLLGIIPRHVLGLPGIVCAPLIHGDGNHLFFNSIPLFVLGSFVMMEGLDSFFAVSAIIILISGILTWLFARFGRHCGASALIMGYWSYLMVNAYSQGTVLAVVLAVVSLYYFGGLFMALFPSEKMVSWEGHVFGFIAGIIAVYITDDILVLLFL